MCVQACKHKGVWISVYAKETVLIQQALPRGLCGHCPILQKG